MKHFGIHLLFMTLIHQEIAFGQSSDNPVVDTSASCDNNYIYFRLNFEKPFQGVIYTENAFSSCLYINGSVNPRITYDIRIPLDRCRTQFLPATGLYENSVIVQQDSRLLEATDQKFLLACGPGTSGSQDNRFTVSFGGLTVQGTLGSTQLVTGQGGSGPGSIAYEVQVQSGPGPNSPAVESAVAVGESISYVVLIQNLLNSDARIGHCWANDGVSEIQLSDERGCSLQTTGNVWGNFQSQASGTNGKVFWNDIRAWAFPTSNRVNIFCNLHLCSGVCPQTDSCTRRKRNVRHNPVSVSDLIRLRGAETNLLSYEPDEDVIKIQGGFQVIQTVNDVRNGFAQRQRNVRLVTGSTKYSFDEPEKTPTPGTICIGQLQFGIGVALLLLVIFVSFLFVLAVGCKHFRRRRLARKAFQHESECRWQQSDQNISTLSSLGTCAQ